MLMPTTHPKKNCCKDKCSTYQVDTKVFFRYISSFMDETFKLSESISKSIVRLLGTTWHSPRIHCPPTIAGYRCTFDFDLNDLALATETRK